MKRAHRASVLTPLVIPENLDLGPAILLPQPQKRVPDSKRTRFGSLREECEATIDRIHATTQDYTAMRLVAEVLLHVVDGTEGSDNAQRCVQAMRCANKKK